MWSEKDVQQVSREKSKVQHCNTKMHKCMGKISKAEFPQAGPFCLSEVKYDSPNIMLDYVRKCMADETQSYPLLQLAMVRPQLKDPLSPRKVSSLKIIQNRAMRLARGLVKPIL